MRILKQLMRDSLYVVDERAIAEAILLRAGVRQLIGEHSFRSDLRGPQVRSFRRDPRARSFRLASNPRLRSIQH